MKRIIVEGTRGKSGTVKIITKSLEKRGKLVLGKATGLNPVLFYKGKKIPIKRQDHHKFFLDTENKKVLKKYKADYIVFENQALSCYTMRVVHNLIKPDIIVIPTIRFEHQDTLGDTLKEIAESFAVNFKGSKVVVTTETKLIVLKIFQKYCNKYGVKLKIINKPELIPGIFSLYLADEVMKILFKRGMGKREYTKWLVDIQRKMRIKYNVTLDLVYFIGSKINDVESSFNVFNHLKAKTSKKFCYVCYFRRDRPERTQAFIPFLKSLSDSQKVEKIFIAGYHLNYVLRKVKSDKLVKTDISHIPSIINFCRRKDLVLVTAVNSVNDFMRNLESILLSTNSKKPF